MQGNAVYLCNIYKYIIIFVCAHPHNLDTHIVRARVPEHTCCRAFSTKVKLASCKYLDGLPTSGNNLGRAFRDVEWEDRTAPSRIECHSSFAMPCYARRRSVCCLRTLLSCQSNMLLMLPDATSSKWQFL